MATADRGTTPDRPSVFVPFDATREPTDMMGDDRQNVKKMAEPTRRRWRFATPAEATIALGLRPFTFRGAYGHRIQWIAGHPRFALVGQGGGA